MVLRSVLSLAAVCGLLWAAAGTAQDDWSRVVRNNRVDEISAALDGGRLIDVDRPAANGKTALMAAARAGRVGLARRLLAAGADANAGNHNGGTPLMFAAAAGDPVVTRLLLDHGADPRRRASNGWTALTMAAVKNRPQVARLLLAHGADPNAPDVYGWTPLMRAVYEGREAMARLLLAQPGIDLQWVNDHGQTALHLAVIRGRRSLAAALLAGGAEQLRDFQGHTPASVAAELRLGELSELLARYQR